MIRTTVSSSLVFADCIELLHLWLQRIYSIWFQCQPSVAVHVQSLLLCCWKRVFAMTSVFSWQNSISLCPALFYTPRPNFPVTPGVSWLPTFAFQSPIMKRTSFLGVNYKKWRRQWHPTTVLLPRKSHGWRSLVGCSPGGRWNLDATQWLHFHFSLSCIGQEMATYSLFLPGEY